MRKTRLELREMGYGIEFHWDKPEGPYYSGAFETPELAAAYFELRFVRNDKEASHLVPRVYDSKKDRQLWAKESPNLNLALTFDQIKNRFL